MLLGATLLPANCALASQTPTKPITQLTSVCDRSDMYPAALNTADKLTPNASILPINAQLIPLEETKETTPVPVAQLLSKHKRKTPGYSNYIGIGGEFGLSGDRTALGSGGLAIFSKSRITNNLSIHSTNVVFGSRTATSTTALTFGIPIKNKLSGQVLVFPFVGGGVLTRNIDGLKIDGLVVGGVDVPVSEKLTATAQVHVGFPGGDTDVGLQFGVGYSFRLF